MYLINQFQQKTCVMLNVWWDEINIMCLIGGMLCCMVEPWIWVTWCVFVCEHMCVSDAVAAQCLLFEHVFTHALRGGHSVSPLLSWLRHKCTHTQLRTDDLLHFRLPWCVPITWAYPHMKYPRQNEKWTDYWVIPGVTAACSKLVNSLNCNNTWAECTVHLLMMLLAI